MTQPKLLCVALCAVLCGAFLPIYGQPGSQRYDPIALGSLSINVGAGFGVPYTGSRGVPFGVKAAVNWGLVDLGQGVITLGLASGGSFSHGSWDYASENTSRVY